MGQLFFKVSSPSSGILLSNGQTFKRFEMITHELGVIAPQMDFLVENLVQCAQRGVGGVTEITKEEYDDWLKKKPVTLPKRWRDEWGEARLAMPTVQPPQSQSTMSSPSPASVVAVNPVSTEGFRPSPLKA